MKHIVTLVQGENTAAAFIFESKQAALSKFHHEMEYAYNAGTTTTLCTVINANGVQISNEKFTAPDPEGDET